MLTANELLNASILIVDDQDANVRLLQRLLQQAGYTNLSTTMNPLEVCALQQRHQHDLILLDLQMPGMDGFEVMERLKLELGTSYLPVIVLTAQPAHKLRALQAGAKDFISKPFDLVEVKTRIHNTLEVRLLHKRLAVHNAALEQTVRERTAALRDSEERFRRLTELASDWYWEQNAAGDFTHVSGPVFETLGLGMGAFLGRVSGDAGLGWDPATRALLQAKIAARQPFLDFGFSRRRADGSRQYFRVSGEPMFDGALRFAGYRGIGAEVLTAPATAAAAAAAAAPAPAITMPVASAYPLPGAAPIPSVAAAPARSAGLAG